MSLTHAVIARVVSPEIEKVYFEDAQNLNTVQEIHDAVIAAAEVPDPLQTVAENILANLHKSVVSPRYYLVADVFISQLENIIKKRRKIHDPYGSTTKDTSEEA